MGTADKEKEKVSLEDYEMLAWENKRMAEFLTSMGLSNDSISNRVINGTDGDVDVARDIITEKIVYSIREKLPLMDVTKILKHIHKRRVEDGITV